VMQWVGRSMSLFGALPTNKTQTMTLTHNGASGLSQLMGALPLAP